MKKTTPARVALAVLAVMYMICTMAVFLVSLAAAAQGYLFGFALAVLMAAVAAHEAL